MVTAVTEAFHDVLFWYIASLKGQMSQKFQNFPNALRKVNQSQAPKSKQDVERVKSKSTEVRV